MVRKNKVLGLAFVALLVMGSLWATAASASAATKFMTEGNVSSTVKADQEENNVFTVDGTTVSCTTAHFESAAGVLSPTETVKVHPTYSGCTAFGFIGAEVATTGCNYILNAKGNVTISCEGSNVIKITAATCEVQVGNTENSERSPITYTNVSGNVLVKPALEDITAVKTKDGLLCPLSGTGTVHNAKYTGSVLAKAFNAIGTQVPITVE